jgi:hypothetical protein
VANQPAFYKWSGNVIGRTWLVVASEQSREKQNIVIARVVGHWATSNAVVGLLIQLGGEIRQSRLSVPARLLSLHAVRLFKYRKSHLKNLGELMWLT